MMSISSRCIISVALSIFILSMTGCSQSNSSGGPAGASATESKPLKNEAPKTAEETTEETGSLETASPAKNGDTENGLPVITFGGAPSTTSSSSQHQNGESKAGSSDVEKIISRLKELQILLGTWRGITKKTYGGFKAVDQSEWVWDFRTNPAQPALVMTSNKSPYYRLARLTYLPGQDRYQLTVTDTHGDSRYYLGKFISPIKEIQGDDKTQQLTYKLEFTQTEPADEKATRFVINQKNNNRYLLEYYRQRGSGDQFIRVDTVSTQREGTSIALIDEGYGDKTCIISGGLGTIAVSYKGSTYYVCCSGCKAAFEEDPEKWLARAAAQKSKKTKR